MGYRPRFEITPALLGRVEALAALRERIQGAAVQVAWIPALQKDTRARNTHSSTAMRPKQEQLLRLLRARGSLSPREIWDGLAISKQGAMDLIRPLVKAKLVKRVGTLKNGRYVLR
jgi:DNA-binding MarR family transcriptional regulator